MKIKFFRILLLSWIMTTPCETLATPLAFQSFQEQQDNTLNRVETPQKILIIGNSGSGKTWTGKAISENLKIPVFHMDQIWWEKDKFLCNRSLEAIINDIDCIIRKERWVLEGVFGIIAKHASPFATTLIWLDLDWDECKANISSRGPQFEEHLVDIEERQVALENLINWASTHYSRDDENSENFFKNLFEGFSGNKVRLQSRTQIIDYINSKIS